MSARFLRWSRAIPFCPSLVLGAVLALAPCGQAQSGPPKEQKPEVMDAFSVSGTRYKPAPIELEKWRFVFGSSDMEPPHLEPTLMGPVVVTATRSPQSAARLTASAHVVESPSLLNIPSVTVDDALRSVPGFTLFRRSDSLTAHPTTQGVSLRGIGPSGASRSLVLLDGVPLNDPFGGWVNWSKVPRDTIARVEVLSGAGATAWGNAALAGAIQVFTSPPRTEIMVLDRPPAPIRWGSRGTASFTATLGDFSTRSVDFVLTRPFARGALQLVAEDFTTAGFRVIAKGQRGPIDTPAWSRHQSLASRWRRQLSSTLELTVGARAFEERRGNGTPYQRNGTREHSASLQLYGQPAPTLSWKLIGYVQDQSFASTFSSINASRTSETPASDQFAVPATAYGASWTGTWQHASGATTSGGDVRFLHGETREKTAYNGSDFTRLRTAGGSQSFAGWFVSDNRRIAKGVRLTTAARLDDWGDENGHRFETDRATGQSLRTDHYRSDHDIELSPNVGLVWTPGAWRWRANAQRAFRRPTLNELYRPFRQGNNVIEANSALKTEHITSLELGGEWAIVRETPKPTTAPLVRRTIKVSFSAPPPPKTIVSLGGAIYWNDLRDAVSNVTVARGPGTFPVFGPLGAGVTGRQRLNLDHTRAQGIELSATWNPKDTLSFNAGYLYSDAVVRSARIAPQLVHKRLAEVPRHTASLGTRWQPSPQFACSARVRWIGRQYDDDENTLRLGEAVVLDVGATHPIGSHLELFVSVQNAADARIETARTPDGIVSIGTPRFTSFGLRGRW